MVVLCSGLGVGGGVGCGGGGGGGWGLLMGGIYCRVFRVFSSQCNVMTFYYSLVTLFLSCEGTKLTIGSKRPDTDHAYFRGTENDT